MDSINKKIELWKYNILCSGTVRVLDDLSIIYSLNCCTKIYLDMALIF